MIRFLSVLSVSLLAASHDASASGCASLEGLYGKCVNISGTASPASLAHSIEAQGNRFTVSREYDGARSSIAFSLEAGAPPRVFGSAGGWEILTCKDGVLSHYKFEQEVFFPGDAPAPDHEVNESLSLKDGKLMRVFSDNYQSGEPVVESCERLR